MDTIRHTMDLLLEHKVGAVVVLKDGAPLGIVTKTDLLKAYSDNLTLDHFVAEIMSTHLETCLDTMERDEAAHILERNRNHHAIVLNKEGNFRGLLSSFDIAVECAKDSRAWPWNRSEDGRFHSPQSKTSADTFGTSPTSTTDEAHITNLQQGGAFQRKSQLGDSFRAYIDHLGYFD